MAEKEIDLQDLFVEILLHWRGIILWMLVGGTALGAFNYMGLQEAMTETLSGQPEKNSLSALKSKMTQAELAETERALLDEYSCRKWQSYMENSALMHLDASRVYQADLVYAVDTDGVHANLVDIYGSLLSTSYMYDFIVSETDGITASDARELISVIDPNASTQNQKNPSFRIVINAGTKKSCNSISKAVQHYIREMHRSVVKDYGISHNITLLQDNITVICNTDILQKQIDVRSRINSLQTEMANLTENFSEEQAQYYQAMSESADKPADKKGQKMTGSMPLKAAASVNPPTRAKYALLGMFLGMIIYIFPIFIKYISDGKLRYADDCTALYQIPVLGHIPAVRETRRLFNGIDRQLYRLRNKDYHGISMEDAARLAAVATAIAAHKKGYGSVYAMGCSLPSGIPAKPSEIIQRSLTADNIKFQTADNFLYNAESMKLLSNAETAVLVEKAGCALHREIFQELEILRRLDVEILGMIIIE